MKLKILIIDDEKMLLKTLNMLLTQEGFVVRSASDGNAAISMFESEHFDLVITDIRMPGMDGLEVARHIKRLDKDVEVIILTGFCTSDNAEEAFKIGVFCFLTKPLEDLDELLIPVTRALERRRFRLGN